MGRDIRLKNERLEHNSKLNNTENVAAHWANVECFCLENTYLEH